MLSCSLVYDSFAYHNSESTQLKTVGKRFYFDEYTFKITTQQPNKPTKELQFENQKSYIEKCSNCFLENFKGKGNLFQDIAIQYGGFIVQIIGDDYKSINGVKVAEHSIMRYFNQFENTIVGITTVSEIGNHADLIIPCFYFEDDHGGCYIEFEVSKNDLDKFPNFKPSATISPC